MTFVTILLGILMTFTVETKSSVSISGAQPVGMQTAYSCSYQKGDIREGDTATLRLSGLEDIRIEAVRLYLRSNKDKGAGQLTITADDLQLYTLSGTYKDWFGAYDNSEYQALGWSGACTLDEGFLTVQLVGTANSLHIQRYEIEYTQPALRPYTVTLMTNDEPETLTESAPGSGVLLPMREDRGEWYFAGWAENELTEPVDLQPVLLPADSRYFPKKDITLWAVWTDLPYPTWQRQTHPESGYYVLALGNYVLSGIVSGGRMALSDDAYIYTSDIYYLDFQLEDTTCTIRCYGALDSYVGYNAAANTLTDDCSPWKARMLADSTWLFIAREDGDKWWVLYQRGENLEVWLHDYILGDNPNSVWSLYRVPDPSLVRHWYSHVWPEAIPMTDNGSPLTATKILRNGHLYIQSGNRLYTPTGQVIR
ncbi:MAG: hypothetical protein IK073_02245 [Paludibacteraceae bacterium]|nr:hypothetical protein [Paludibacteraceae bacterium]